MSNPIRRIEYTDDIEALINALNEKFGFKIPKEAFPLDHCSYDHSIHDGTGDDGKLEYCASEFRKTEVEDVAEIIRGTGKFKVVKVVKYGKNSYVLFHPNSWDTPVVSEMTVASDMKNSPVLEKIISEIRANGIPISETIYDSRDEAIGSGNDIVMYIEKEMAGGKMRDFCKIEYVGYCQNLNVRAFIESNIRSNGCYVVGTVLGGGISFVPGEYRAEYVNYDCATDCDRGNKPI